MTRVGIIAVNMDANGAVVEENGKSYTITLPDQLYDKVVSEGLIYQLTIPVKKPGAYQMRVAIVDERTGKVGAASQFLQIPDPKKKDRPAVSGIVLQNHSIAGWENIEKGSTQAGADPTRDTSLRRFSRGTILQYGYEVYQAALDKAKKPSINTRVRLFRDGQLVFEGEPRLIDVGGQADVRRIKSGGAISLAEQMELGEYVLQIVVKDEIAKNKYATATQFVQFEVVE